MTPKIYVALSTFAKDNERPLQLLKDSGFIVKLNETGQRLVKAQVIDCLAGVEGVIAGLEPYDADVIAALPDLKCISRCGVGVDNIDLACAKAQKVAVLNTPGAVIGPVAELTLSMIFDLMRQVTAHTELMRKHRWERITGSQIAGKTVGVIGLGRIGRRVAELLRLLGCRVIGYDLRPDTQWAKEHDVKIVGLMELLAASDIVTLHITSDPVNPFILGKKELLVMKKGALIINTARGSFIDEEALVEMLKSGHLSGAGLDVFKEEPYHGPLCDLSNVVLTPHIATLTRESRLKMEEQAVENIIRYFEGK